MAINRDKKLKKIAKSVFSVETLETRKNDLLDFYSVSVWDIKEALEKAYEAGKKQTCHNITQAIRSELGR